MPHDWISLMRNYRGCHVCGYWHLAPVIHHGIWDAHIHPADNHAYCQTCLELRMGRKIRIQDIRWELPWNIWRRRYEQETQTKDEKGLS